MKTDKSLILCDERIADIRQEIAEYKEKERAAKDAQGKLKQKLVQHYVEKTKEELFKGIEFGDKVRVTLSGTLWRGEDKVVVEEGFLDKVYIDPYYTTDYVKDYVRVSLNKIKKDGTRSLRTTDFTVGRILKVEKV